MSQPFSGEDLTGPDSSGSLGDSSSEQHVFGAPLVGDDVSADTGQAPLSEPQQGATDAGGEVRYNPKWNGLLGKLPHEFHAIIADDLKEWDRNYSSLSQEIAPWKQFSRQGASPETLQQAWQLFQTIQQNPMEIHRRLGEALKEYLPNQQQEEETNEEEEYSEEVPDISSNPAYKKLQQQVEHLQSNILSQQQAQQTEQLTKQYSDQIETYLNDIETKYGEFDREDVLKRVASQMQRGEQPDIGKAYMEQQAFIKSILEKQGGGNGLPGKSAPMVMPTNGGMPPNSQQSDLSTKQGRMEKFGELIKLAQQQ